MADEILNTTELNEEELEEVSGGKHSDDRVVLTEDGLRALLLVPGVDSRDDDAHTCRTVHAFLSFSVT